MYLVLSFLLAAFVGRFSSDARVVINKAKTVVDRLYMTKKNYEVMIGHIVIILIYLLLYVATLCFKASHMGKLPI